MSTNITIAKIQDLLDDDKSANRADLSTRFVIRPPMDRGKDTVTVTAMKTKTVELSLKEDEADILKAVAQFIALHRKAE